MYEAYKTKFEELEDRYRLLADNLIEAMFVLDSETLQFEFITNSIESISGYSADEYLNLTVKDRMMPDSYHTMLRILDKAKSRYQQGIIEVQTIEVELIHKDLSTYWAQIKAKILDKPKKSLKILGIINEITERKKIEQKQMELIKTLGEALAEKENLLKEVKVLKSLLPICSGCKRVRDEEGKWWPLDVYIKNYTRSDITHSICPDCSEIFQKL